MHFKTLRVFCDVVRQRSFSRAADDNHISQSAASQMVSQLEDSLGVKLIDRSKRPFVLTPEGDFFYRGCRGVVQQYASLQEKVRSLHEEVVGRVRVSSIYSIGLSHLNQYIQRFLQDYPKANVRLEYQHPDKVYQAIDRDTADLGLVSYPRSSRTIEAVAWREEPMVFVCSPRHHLAGQSEIELEALAGERMVNFDRDLTIRREIDRVLHQRRVDVEVVMEFDNIETIKRAIEVDLGVGLLPAPTVHREVAAGSLVAIPFSTNDLVRPIGIIHRRGRELNATAQRFVAMLQSMDLTSHGEPFATQPRDENSQDTNHNTTGGPHHAKANGQRSRTAPPWVTWHKGSTTCSKTSSFPTSNGKVFTIRRMSTTLVAWVSWPTSAASTTTRSSSTPTKCCAR